MTPLTQAAVNLARTGAISLTEAWRVQAEQLLWHRAAALGKLARESR